MSKVRTSDAQAKTYAMRALRHKGYFLTAYEGSGASVEARLIDIDFPYFS